MEKVKQKLLSAKSEKEFELAWKRLSELELLARLEKLDDIPTQIMLDTNRAKD